MQDKVAAPESITAKAAKNLFPFRKLKCEVSSHSTPGSPLPEWEVENEASSSPQALTGRMLMWPGWGLWVAWGEALLSGASCRASRHTGWLFSPSISRSHVLKRIEGTSCDHPAHHGPPLQGGGPARRCEGTEAQQTGTDSEVWPGTHICTPHPLSQFTLTVLSGDPAYLCYPWLPWLSVGRCSWIQEDSSNTGPFLTPASTPSMTGS